MTPRVRAGHAGARRRVRAAWAAALGLAVLAATQPVRGQTAPLDGRWLSESGDVIELATGPKGTFGRLASASPSGLGRYFESGQTILHVAGAAGGGLTWTILETRAKISEDSAARTAEYLALAGVATAQADPDGLGCVLSWQPVRERHTFDQDGWFKERRRIEPTPPPLVLKLRRGPELTIWLVRGDGLEPALALHHGLTYVVEFVGYGQALPEVVPIALHVGGETLRVDTALVERGVGSRYRSRPFSLAPRTDGLPLP